MIVRGGGGDVTLTFVSSTSFTLQKRLPLLTSCIVWRAFCGFPAWTYVGRGWISSRTIIAGTQQLDGTWKHLKNGDLNPCSTKETTGVPKTVQLCLQLDLASQRCLVTDCSISTATSTLAPLTSNSGKKEDWIPPWLMWFGWLKIIKF